MNKVSFYDTIISPVITEKSSNMSSQNKVVFKVRDDANKKTLKKNIEKIFKVNVVKVNIIKKNGLPIVLNQNGIFYPEWFEGDWEKENFRMSKIYHSADYVLWQSKFCKKASEKFLGKRIGEGE